MFKLILIPLILLAQVFAFEAQKIDYRAQAREFDKIHHASTSLKFQNLAGWFRKGLLIRKKVNLNQNEDRSLDPLENDDLSIAFELNYQQFFTDPNYRCHRPNFYEYFSELTGSTPNEESNCKMNREITIVSESLSSSGAVFKRTLDPNRIYQIHYLFAGKGKQMMSKWGHAMFRLIICAPDREVGPNCLNDISEHVVVSYRANVEDININYLKGLRGSYSSQLYLMNFNDVLNEYNKGEMRDIISLPLNFTQEQVTQFTNRVLENYWSYSGRYYFLTNNCATEALQLMKIAYPEEHPLLSTRTLHPLSLYKLLDRLEIIDTTLLDDEAQAIKTGYLFKGINSKLLSSLNLFLDSKRSSGDQRFDEFAFQSSPVERRLLYGEKLKVSNNKAKTIANALRLEEQIQFIKEQMLSKKLTKKLFGKDSGFDQNIKGLKELLKVITDQSNANNGYGIPLEEEMKSHSSEEVGQIFSTLKEKINDIKNLAVNYYPEDIQELKDIVQNREWLLSEMSKL